VLAQVSIFPIGKGKSVSKFVAQAVDEIDKSGLDYRVTAMGTVIEGDWTAVMKVIKKMREKSLKHAKRVYMTIAIDDRKDSCRRIESKVKAVEDVLGKTLRK
jgi:uncharacterized protein (TIGR00106 family)